MNTKKYLLFMLILISTSFILCAIGFFILEVKLDDEWGVFLLNFAVAPLCMVFGISIAQLFTRDKAN